MDNDFDSVASGAGDFGVKQQVSIAFEEVTKESCDPIFLDELPDAVHDAVNNAIFPILDRDNGRVVITGSRKSGKTFLTEALVNKMNEQYPFLRFIRIRQDSETMISDPNTFASMAPVIQQRYEDDDPNAEICIVTNNVNLAFAASFTPIRIIFETDLEIYESLIHDPTKQFADLPSWGVVNADEVSLNREEIISTLTFNCVGPIVRDYGVSSHDLENIDEFVKAIEKRLDKDPELSNDSIRHNAARWAVALKKAASTAKLKDIDLVDVKFNLEELFFTDSERVSGEPESIQETLRSAGASVGNSRGSVRMTEENEKSKNGASEFSTPNSLKKALESVIVGQEHAIERVVDELVIPSAGLNDDDKPLRTLLFLGPTGVGKTEVGKLIASNVKKDPMNVIRLDMSEYSENTPMKLFGSPPGYVDSDKGGVLTSQVLENPNSLILLDEVEKAHPEIWNVFLQVLDTGHMTTAMGQDVDFTNTIIVMTSNIGSSDLAKNATGFGGRISESDERRQTESAIEKSLLTYFKPEFLNRIDAKIVFNRLPERSLKLLVRREMKKLTNKAKDQGYTVETRGGDIVNRILQRSDVKSYGAREIQRVLQQMVSNPLAKAMVDRRVKSKNLIVTTDSSDVVIKPKTAAVTRGRQETRK